MKANLVAESLPLASGTPAAKSHHRRDTCRACGGTSLSLFLSLGPQPLANAFLKESAPAQKCFPLDVYYCQTCSLVQLLDVIDSETLFAEYVYVTGTSDTMRVHNQEYARTVSDLTSLTQDDLVVEIGSNDGSLLQCFQQRGSPILGIEPARNIAALADARGLRTLNRFFSSATASEIKQSYGSAKVILANNVLAHVDNTLDFLKGCREILHPAGLLAVEVPYVRHLIEKLEYDTIYHEHLCYFSISTLARLFERAGLSIMRVDEVPVHGGSLRVYARSRERHQQHAAEVVAAQKKEMAEGLTSLLRYVDFADRVVRNRLYLRNLVHRLVHDGKTVAAYGAPAKGSTLLNYCDIGKAEIPYVVDRNAMKVGLYQPGTGIPVLPVSTLLEEQPDYLLILAWNFEKEIVEQQKEYARRGGRFIIPIPDPRIL